MAQGTCSCGRSLPRLQEVSGRMADFLYRPDKVPVFGISILDTFAIHIPGFKQVQIIQDQYDFLTFRIVKDNAFSEESLSILKKNVREIFGEAMRYEIEFVDRIEQTERGKYRFSICNIGRGESS
jgi:phenylacetate-CoA ligase